MKLGGKTVVLGVSGGIAAYKAPELVRALRQDGARVRVVMTRSAQEFITPLTLQTVSGSPVGTDLFDLGQESTIGHIDLADSADVLLVAPATANVIGKLAHGIADDLLTTVALATRARVVVAPAMNVHMWGSTVVQENVASVRRRGVIVVEPDTGSLACGYEGAGRLPDAPVLVESVKAALATRDLARERILVTAGPTREALDPVRYLSNRSSGKMGYALARVAARRGATVVLVSGPTAISAPPGVERIEVESADEMAAAVRSKLSGCTVVIAAAAVADYKPAARAAEKAAKIRGRHALALENTPDIVGTLVRPRPDTIVVGFAAETSDLLERARGKLARKRLDLIVANDVMQPGAGFDVDTNVVTLVDHEGAESLPLLDKEEVAEAILDRVVRLRGVRARPSRKPRRPPGARAPSRRRG